MIDHLKPKLVLHDACTQSWWFAKLITSPIVLLSEISIALNQKTTGICWTSGWSVQAEDTLQWVQFWCAIFFSVMRETMWAYKTSTLRPDHLNTRLTLLKCWLMGSFLSPFYCPYVLHFSLYIPQMNPRPSASTYLPSSSCPLWLNTSQCPGVSVSTCALNPFCLSLFLS